MRSTEPKTQREILASLGDIPRGDHRWSFVETWKSKTLENRHVAFVVILLTFFFVAHHIIASPSRSTVLNAPSQPSPSAIGAHAAVHFSRDRPLTMLVTVDVPPVDNDLGAWEALINTWDVDYAMIVVLSTSIPPPLLRQLDTFLKKQGLASEIMMNKMGAPRQKGVIAQHRASWFLAAQIGGDVPFVATSPRLSAASSGFQSIVFGQQVEIMTAASLDHPLLLKRLREGQGDVSTRIAVLPDWKGLRPSDTHAKMLSESGPVTVVAATSGAGQYRIVSYDSAGITKEETFQLPFRKRCVIRPFEVSDWQWKCTPV